MATNSFLKFNESNTNIQTYAQYLAATERLNGFPFGSKPSSILTNRFYRDNAAMAYAFGEFMKNQGYNADPDDIATLISNLPLAIKNTNTTLLLVISASASDTYVVTESRITAYTDGLPLIFKPTAVGNTGSATININGLGAKNIEVVKSGAYENLSTGQILVNGLYQLTYSTTRGSFILENPSFIPDVGLLSASTTTDKSSVIAVTNEINAKVGTIAIDQNSVVYDVITTKNFDLVLNQESLTYGGRIIAIAEDANYLYIGGDTVQKVFKIDKATMLKVAESAAYGGDIKAIKVNATHVFVAGRATNVVRKLLISDLSFVSATPSYGGDINAIDIDATHIYAGGATTLTVRKYDISTMALSAESPSYGGAIDAIALDANNVYVGGATTVAVRKYLKSTMALLLTAPTYGAEILALTVDSTHVYAGGITTNSVRKYLSSDMTFVSELNIGQSILALDNDTDNVYVGGGGDFRLKKVLKSSMALLGQSASYGAGIYAVSADFADYVYIGGTTINIAKEYLKRPVKTIYGGAV